MQPSPIISNYGKWGGKSPGNNGVVLEDGPAGSKCEDYAKGSIQRWQRAARRARGLAKIVARGGRSAGAAGDPLGNLAGHPAPPFATADLSVFPSGNHLVRFRVRVPGLADRSGVAGHGSDTGGEFRVGHLFVGVSGRRACFCNRSWPLGGHQDDQRQRATEFATSVGSFDGHCEFS